MSEIPYLGPITLNYSIRGPMYKLLLLLLIVAVSACSTSVDIDEEDPIDAGIANAARRIDIPRQLDTLRVNQPFRLKATVDCHNPIIGLRVEFTDKTLAQGDGEVLGSITLPTSGTTEVVVDSLITLTQLSKTTPDKKYGFVLVEVYDGREFRAGFEPVIILD